MRKPLIVGNWKMYKTITEAEDYVAQIKDRLPAKQVAEVELAVPTLFLQSLARLTAASPLKIVAENCFYQDEGAFTGETSPLALRELGIKHVILGGGSSSKATRWSTRRFTPPSAPASARSSASTKR